MLPSSFNHFCFFDGSMNTFNVCIVLPSYSSRNCIAIYSFIIQSFYAGIFKKKLGYSGKPVATSQRNVGILLCLICD